MTDLRKAAEIALEALEGALSDDQPYIEKSKKAAEALRQALAQPEQEPVKCMYPYCETASGCDGPCSKPLTTPVDAVNIPQERVDETAKCEHEPVAHLWECIGRWTAMIAHDGEDANLAPPDWFVDAVKAATAPPKREFVLLAKEDMPAGDNPMFDTDEFYAGVAWAQTKLKEKNGG